MELEIRPLFSSDLVSFGHPVQTGFRSVDQIPTSCQGCEGHPLHLARLQTECTQILLVVVYRSQVGCRHLQLAHSGQTHGANPRAWNHRQCF